MESTTNIRTQAWFFLPSGFLRFLLLCRLRTLPVPSKVPQESTKKTTVSAEHASELLTVGLEKWGGGWEVAWAWAASAFEGSRQSLHPQH